MSANGAGTYRVYPDMVRGKSEGAHAPECRLPGFGRGIGRGTGLLNTRTPCSDEFRITEPPRRRRKGSANFTVRKMPRRFTAMVRSRSSGRNLAKPAHTPLMPALAKTRSSRPHLHLSRANARVIAAVRATSATNGSTTPPTCVMRSHVPWISLREWSKAATFTPAVASRTAAAWPIPCGPSDQGDPALQRFKIGGHGLAALSLGAHYSSRPMSIQA